MQLEICPMCRCTIAERLEDGVSNQDVALVVKPDVISNLHLKMDDDVDEDRAPVLFYPIPNGYHDDVVAVPNGYHIEEHKAVPPTPEPDNPVSNGYKDDDTPAVDVGNNSTKLSTMKLAKEPVSAPL